MRGPGAPAATTLLLILLSSPFFVPTAAADSRSPRSQLNLILSVAIRSAASGSSSGIDRGMASTSPERAATAAAAAAAATDPTAVAAQTVRRHITFRGGGIESEAAEIDDQRGPNEAVTAAVAQASTYQRQRQHVLPSLIAGVGSGALASVVCAPLDLIRTRMQVMGDIRAHGAPPGAAGHLPSLSVYRALADIVKQDGVKGCFRGLGATLATVPAFWGLYFPLYEYLKKELHGWYGARHGGELRGGAGGLGPCPPLVHMGSAIIAGAAADFVCNPMFLVRTRMQTEALHYFEVPTGERRPHGVLGTIRTVYGEGGVPAFWRGLTASLMGLGHVAIQFPVYEFLKAEARAKSPTNEETPADLLLASGVSKMCASILTYPHEVIRSRMMDARGPDAGQGALKTIRRILAKEGWGSMYTGIHVSLLRVVPNCCITFMSYELILRWAKENVGRQ